MKIKRIICASLAVLSLSTALLSSPVNAAPKMGDVNLDGIINVVDVSLTQQYLTGDKKIKFYPAYADFDRSGILDINDISLLQQYLSKSIIVYGDFIFQMSSNSKLISQSYFGNDTNVTVPGFLPGYNYVVTEIGSNTFSNNSKIATVTLPQNIGLSIIAANLQLFMLIIKTSSGAIRFIIVQNSSQFGLSEIKE